MTKPKKEEDRVICSVVDGLCLAPAGIGVQGVGYGDGYGNARGICSVCGDPVCGNCSLIRTRNGRRKRICHNCFGTDKNSEEIIMARLEKLANKRG